MFNKKMMQLPGVSVKRSVLIGLLRSLSFLTDIAIIIYLADILALLCGAHTSGGPPAADTGTGTHTPVADRRHSGSKKRRNGCPRPDV